MAERRERALACGVVVIGAGACSLSTAVTPRRPSLMLRAAMPILEEPR